MERTLAIIKPDSVAARNVGAIIDRIEQNDLKIVALRSICLTREEAEGFYV